MENQNGEVHVDETEASGGSKEGVVRWILGLGLLLAIIAMSLVWIIPAMMQGDVEEEITATGNIDSMEEEGDGTDSILIEDADDIEGAGESDAGTIENDVDPTPEPSETVEPE